MRHCLITLLLIILIPFSPALAGTPSADRLPFGETVLGARFANITLPYDACPVISLLQDNRGMLWLGTKRGLVCYNGHTFHLCYYTPGKSDENTIQALAQPDPGHLYAATDNGIRVLSLDTWRFEEPPVALRQLKAVRSIAVSGGKLWIGMRNDGLYAYDLARGTLAKQSLPNGGDALMTVLCSASDGLLIGSFAGLYRYDAAKHRICKVKLSGVDLPSIFSMYHDALDHCVWIGTSGRLLRYDTRTHQAETVKTLPGIVLKSVTRAASGGLLYIGTESGLIAYDVASGQVRRFEHDTRNPQSLGNNIVYDLVCGKDGRVFVATGHGLSVMSVSPAYGIVRLPELVAGNEGNAFTFMLRDTDGALWLGGENGLLRCAEGSPTVWYSTRNAGHPLRQDRIRDLYIDREGDLWISTDGGVAVLDRRTRQFRYPVIGNKSNNTNWTYGVYEDPRGRMWIATCMSGLFVIDKRRIMQPGVPCRLEPADVFRRDLIQSVYQMTTDDRGHIWVNTDRGLIEIDPLSRRCQVRNVWLDYMCSDGRSLWYDDRGALFRYDTRTCRSVDTGFRIAHGTANAMALGGGKLWVASIDGVTGIDCRTQKVMSTAIPDLQYHAALYDTVSQKLFLGGNDCVAVADMTSLLRYRGGAVPRISAIVCDTVTVPCAQYRPGAEIHIASYRNVGIEISDLAFSPGGDTFYYRLNGDEQWKRVSGADNRIDFAVMTGGKNALQLCSQNPLTDPSATVYTYYIVVPWPWYLSFWAWCTYIVLVAAAALMFVRMQKRKSERRFRRAERERTLELARMKAEFFVNVSHELKTPLSLIIAPLGKLVSENTNARMRETLKGIQRNAMRLNALIYKIVDYRQTEYETENTLIRSHTDMVALVRGCVSSFDAIMGERDIDVVFTTGVAELWLDVDVVKMESVVTNLLSNAVKHVRSSEGRVTVTLAETPGQVSLSVADNGDGIPRDEMQMVFMRYYQCRGEDRNNHGTGIGLFLVKKYVEMHGGTVTVRNDGGAVFSFVMPKCGNAIDNTPAQPDEAAETSGEADTARDTLLIIDDNREIVDFLVSSLGDTYTCLKAYNGREGLEQVRQHTVHLVIVDQMMPVMGGFEFVREMKRNAATAETPIIMLTAKDDADTEMQSIRLGVDVFVPKPFDFRKMQLHVMRLVKHTRDVRRAVEMRHMVEHPDVAAATEAQQCDASPDEQFMHRVLEVIEGNMEREGFNVTSLAETLAIDQKQLYRKMKQLTGQTPVAFLRQMRLRRAAELLKHDRYTVSEVMYMVGMTNPSYFSKCFAEVYGVTPKAYVWEHSDKSDKG